MILVFVGDRCMESPGDLDRRIEDPTLAERVFRVLDGRRPLFVSGRPEWNTSDDDLWSRLGESVSDNLPIRTIPCLEAMGGLHQNKISLSGLPSRRVPGGTWIGVDLKTFRNDVAVRIDPETAMFVNPVDLPRINAGRTESDKVFYVSQRWEGHGFEAFNVRRIKGGLPDPDFSAENRSFVASTVDALRLTTLDLHSPETSFIAREGHRNGLFLYREVAPPGMRFEDREGVSEEGTVFRFVSSRPDLVSHLSDLPPNRRLPGGRIEPNALEILRNIGEDEETVEDLVSEFSP